MPMVRFAIAISLLLACAHDLSSAPAKKATPVTSPVPQASPSRSTDPVAKRAAAQRDCDGGNATACRQLALYLLIGEGGPQDSKSALITWFQECVGNDYDACQNLGWAYTRGIGVYKNETIGAGYQLLACEHSQYRDGCALYYHAVLLGAGMPRDEKLATTKLDELCQQSVRGGCIFAAHADELGLGGRTADRAKAEKVYLANCQAEKPHGDACELLANVQLSKSPPDTKAAMTSLERACGRYVGTACASLARISPAKDREGLLKRACSLGVNDACAAKQ
jgi:uncharacterized protein